jgi:hypothetical protein
MRSATRLRAGILALLYLCGYFGSALHEASVRHAICEHGEFVDLPALHVPAPDCTTDSGARELGPTLVARSSDANELEHVHDHCSNVVPVSRPASSHSAIGSPITIVAFVPAAQPDSIGHTQRFPLYLLAPSHSPPRV